MTLLLQSYGLMEIIEHGGKDVTVACTIDGTELSWKIGHVTAGVKITDPQARNPRKNDKLVMGADGTKGVQSRDLCFPLQVTIGKDNKQLLHTQFKPFTQKSTGMKTSLLTITLLTRAAGPSRVHTQLTCQHYRS